MIEIKNPLNSLESKLIRLWPSHCVAGTPGAEVAKDLNLSKVDIIIEKGKEPNTEMYSVFYDVWNKSNGLAKIMKERNITDVWVVGLALDFCVKESALHSAMEGFKTMVLKEATRATSGGDWDQIKNELCVSGVKLVGYDDLEFIKLKELKC